MAERGNLLHCDEALRFIEQIPDAITRNLVNLAFVHTVKTVQLERRTFPRTDMDMLFLAVPLNDFFSEHNVLSRTLEGEKVGAWFDEEAGS